jgi:hypothetical protein
MEPITDDPLVQVSLEKKTAKDCWFSDYFPFIPEQYGIRTFETTIGTPGQFTSEIIGTELIPYVTGALLGTIFKLEDGYELFYTEKKYIYWLKADDKAIFSSDCELASYPSGCIIGKINDGMNIVLNSPFYLVYEDYCREISDDISYFLVHIQDVKINGKRYNNALVLWTFSDIEPFIPLDFYGKDQEIGLRLPTDVEANYRAVNRFLILGFKQGLIASGRFFTETGEIMKFSELVSVSR